jgi:ribosome biogenesis protein UTP30
MVAQAGGACLCHRGLLSPWVFRVLSLNLTGLTARSARPHRRRRSMAQLIDDHVSAKQCSRAIAALVEYALKQQQKREENELLPGKEENIWLQIAVKEVHAEAKLKPHRMCANSDSPCPRAYVAHSPIKYPLVDPRSSAVCLITKDPQREYKDLLEKAGIRFINRVVGIEKLKGKFKSFEARRALLRENALFLADDRVIPLLPRLLGKTFFTAKKWVLVQRIGSWPD